MISSLIVDSKVNISSLIICIPTDNSKCKKYNNDNNKTVNFLTIFMQMLKLVYSHAFK